MKKSEKKSIDDMMIGEVRELVKQFNEIKQNFVDSHPWLKRFVIVRTFSSGVHFGTLAWAYEKQVILHDAKRLWQWQGAFTLSEVSQHGISGAKISCAVPEIYLPDSNEIIPCSEKAEKILSEMKEHKP